MEKGDVIDPFCFLTCNIFIKYLEGSENIFLPHFDHMKNVYVHKKDFLPKRWKSIQDIKTSLSSQEIRKCFWVSLWC